jgi:hypothetical protein
MILWGLRGVGKTVLLLEFESVADQEGWTPSEPIEIRSDTDFRAELADAAYAALLRLNRRKAIGERLKSFTGLLAGFKAGVGVDGNLEFSFDGEVLCRAAVFLPPSRTAQRAGRSRGAAETRRGGGSRV